MTETPPPAHDAAMTTGGWRHWFGFLVSGGLAYLIDVGVSLLLHDGVGWPWAVSRLLGISAAMVVAWLSHRRLTFAIAKRPTMAEFLRYASMAWMAAGLNYSVFLLLIWLVPSIYPALAIAIAAGVAMLASYAGMRFAVFTR